MIKVEKLAAEAGSEVTFDDVILVSTDSDVKCGDAVANASVTASVVGEGKSKKLLFTSTRERLAITRRMVTDSHILRLRSRRSTLNWY